MAFSEEGTRQRDSLPSINHLEFDKVKADRHDEARYTALSNINNSVAISESPTTVYSGAPPPYSSAISSTFSVQTLPGYISPPESTTRRSTREEKQPAVTYTSLPSIHEALGDRVTAPGSLPPPPPQKSGSNTSRAPVGQAFPDAPSGPSNPFSQPPATMLDTRLSHTTYTAATVNDQSPTHPPTPSAHATAEAARISSQKHTYPTSPRFSTSTSSVKHRSSLSSIVNPYETSVRQPHPGRQEYSYSQHQPPPLPVARTVEQPSSFQFEPNTSFDESRNPFVKTNPPAHYGDTVKRYLDVYDAELAFHQVHEDASRNADFSAFWLQKYRQSKRSEYFSESLPSVLEMEEAVRQSQRAVENLSRLREMVILQQTVLSEERARAARHPHVSDDYHSTNEDYKTGGFASGEAKKRRGKAAPPGRCHSCNRAETPEWRRGPDGARTLCNACGLHYAKLTRKIGVNKASSMTGSSLRPKTLDPRQ